MKTEPQGQVETNQDGKIDPVCGMTVSSERPAGGSSDYQGYRYAFCSGHCRKRFEADPSKYLSKLPQAAAPPLPQGKKSVYICPMHPEIRKEGPGSCPECGMALEPLEAMEKEEPNSELADMTRRFRISLVLSIPVIVLAMVHHLPSRSLHMFFSSRIFLWIEFLLTLPVVLWYGRPLIARGWLSVVHRHLNMFTLIGLGVLTAFIYSVIATIVPDIFPPSFRDAQGRIGVYFEAAATIKPSTPEAIRILHEEGIRIVMLTGDNQVTAQAVAKKLGIDEVEAQVLPDRKIEIVRQLQNQGRIVAMAGDGINDAPALAQANVGIAMGTGTDIAIESAGVTLVKGDLRGIARAITLSRSTMRNIRQNLFFAFIYNALGIPIAAGVLYPVTGILLSPIFAAAAMSFSSISVISNALRLRNAKL